MIKFLLKGILRDRSRSLFPIITIAMGVALTVLLYAWMDGAIGDMIDMSADMSTGHVKVMSYEYYQNMDQAPIDLALTNREELLARFRETHPEMDWVARINFGGLLDVPGKDGETQAQATVAAMAMDILTPGTGEIQRMSLDKSLVRGRLPQAPTEILIGDKLATTLEIEMGDEVTLISSTMYGAMSFTNFTISGTVKFGIPVLDKGGAIVADLQGAGMALDMADAATEILGIYRNGEYTREGATVVRDDIMAMFDNPDDPYRPYVIRLEDQNDMGPLLDFAGAMLGILSFVFIGAMFVVLWNTGLMSSLRRYGEMGLRLAVGEAKGQIYRRLLLESIMIGVIGTVIGTALGLLIAWPLQTHGFNISEMMGETTMFFRDVMTARITPPCFYVGFIPGLIAPLLGTAVAGRGIYKRQTASLFKEFESY